MPKFAIIATRHVLLRQQHVTPCAELNNIALSKGLCLTAETVVLASLSLRKRYACRLGREVEQAQYGILLVGTCEREYCFGSTLNILNGSYILTSSQSRVVVTESAETLIEIAILLAILRINELNNRVLLEELQAAVETNLLTSIDQRLTLRLYKCKCGEGLVSIAHTLELGTCP